MDEPRLNDLEKVLVDRNTPDDECWEWRIKGTDIRHHPSEPAVQWKNGDWEWYWMGREHRLDGPSSCLLGHYFYHIHGWILTRLDWESNPTRLKFIKDRTNLI